MNEGQGWEGLKGEKGQPQRDELIVKWGSMICQELW